MKPRRTQSAKHRSSSTFDPNVRSAKRKRAMSASAASTSRKVLFPALSRTTVSEQKFHTPSNDDDEITFVGHYQYVPPTTFPSISDKYIEPNPDSYAEQERAFEKRKNEILAKSPYAHSSVSKTSRRNEYSAVPSPSPSPSSAPELADASPLVKTRCAIMLPFYKSVRRIFQLFRPSFTSSTIVPFAYTTTLPFTSASQRMVSVHSLFVQLLLFLQTELDWVKQHIAMQHVSIVRIHSKVPERPKDYPPSAIPEKIWNRIQRNTTTQVKFICSKETTQLAQNITFYFADERRNSLAYYFERCQYMLAWLRCVSFLQSKESTLRCGGENITLFLYFTLLPKRFPVHGNDRNRARDIVLDTVHVNTAFTYTCPEPRDTSKPTEIVLFRREEWFKVFLHETFHYYNLDFSSMDRALLRTQSKLVADYINVSCTPDLYECYCETWARILNLAYLTIHKNQTIHFFEHALAQESDFACAQACKVLSFKGIHYTDMIQHERHVRDVYREKTNVFAYYVLTASMLCNINGFMEWCFMNQKQLSIMQMLVFKKTPKNLKSFVQLLCESAIHLPFLDKMEECEHAFRILRNPHATRATAPALTSLRMTRPEHDLWHEP